MTKNYEKGFSLPTALKDVDRRLHGRPQNVGLWNDARSRLLPDQYRERNGLFVPLTDALPTAPTHPMRH